jgi:hypothetical protein
VGRHRRVRPFPEVERAPADVEREQVPDLEEEIAGPEQPIALALTDAEPLAQPPLPRPLRVQEGADRGPLVLRDLHALSGVDEAPVALEEPGQVQRDEQARVRVDRLHRVHPGAVEAGALRPRDLRERERPPVLALRDALVERRPAQVVEPGPEDDRLVGAHRLPRLRAPRGGEVAGQEGVVGLAHEDEGALVLAHDHEPSGYDVGESPEPPPGSGG